jgi:enoyl-CoA hydratase
VIDKDRNPKWSPPRIEDVTPEWWRLICRNRRDELKFD